VAILEKWCFDMNRKDITEAGELDKNIFFTKLRTRKDTHRKLQFRKARIANKNRVTKRCNKPGESNAVQRI